MDRNQLIGLLLIGVILIASTYFLPSGDDEPTTKGETEVQNEKIAEQSTAEINKRTPIEELEVEDSLASKDTSITSMKSLPEKTAVLENEEIKNIYTALGVKLGTEEDSKALDTSKLRYHKVIIMCDADVDGSHIETLILTFFFRHMKELVEGGNIYIATPPLYQVKKGKENRYCWSDEARDKAIAELKGAGKESSVSVQRYKGLGEMNAEQLWTTTMDPGFRTLRQVSIDSAAEADRIFSMLMGDEVPPRREFIEKNAKYANVDI